MSGSAPQPASLARSSVPHIYMRTSVSECQTCVVQTAKKENSPVHMLNVLKPGVLPRKLASNTRRVQVLLPSR